MGRKPTSKRDIDHRALSLERGEIPFDSDNPKHTGIHADTSKLTDEEVNGNPLYWRERIKRARGVAFDDTAKMAFLEALRLSGKITIACRETGVHRQTVLRHREKDAEFEVACDLMLELHAKDIVQRLEEQAMDGFHNDVFNAKTGEIIGTKITYETPLRVALLKRFDPDGYKDRSEVDVTSGGKVIAAPPVASMEEFEAMAEQLRKDHRATQEERERQDAEDAAG
jgi:hypothetical protein